MAVNYQSIATATSGGTAGTSLTVGKPTGLAAGDVMIFGLSVDNSSTVTLTGWTSIASQSPGDNRVFETYYKVATSADASASDFTATLGTSRFWLGFIIRLSDSAVDIQSDTDLVASSSSPSFSGGITPGQASSVFIFACATRTGTVTLTSNAITTSDPTWTERSDQQNSSGAGCTLAVTTATRTESTATGNYSAVVSTSTDTAATIFSIGTTISPTVSAGTLTLSATVNAAVPQASSQVDAGTLTLSATVNASTPTATTGKWTNTSKNAAANVSNISKS